MSAWNRGNLNRRQFFSASAALGLAALGRRTFAQTPAAHGARVLHVRSEFVVRDRAVSPTILSQMLGIALRGVIGAADEAEAWRAILKDDDVIALKFNRSGAEELGTTLPMARALVASLTSAGFAPDRVVAIEAPDAAYDELRLRRPAFGWTTDEVDFRSGKDRLAAALDEVTAIINVPFLKTHNIAGATCCLKNLSHALVKHPARFHDNHCSPYIADVVALPAIRSKLRLHVVNALRVVFEGGPEARDEFIWEAGTVLAGTDPVAIDAVGLGVLNETRQKLSLPPIDQVDGTLNYLKAAAERGLGIIEPHRIEVLKIRA